MSGARELVVLANRAAGTLVRMGGRPPLERLAREAGFAPRVIYTRGPRHLRRMLREQVIGRTDRVAVAGGDGTVHLAVQELANRDVALGILPQGTANNFANALRLPHDLPSAFRVIAEGRPRAVDLGEAGGEYFTEAAGVGVFADLLASTGAHHQWRNVVRGGWVVLKTFVLDRPRRLAITIDGERLVEDAFNVTVANGASVGYNIPIAPGARVADAQLDVVIVGALGRSEMIAYYRAIRVRMHLGLPKVQTRRGREISIAARHPCAVHVDERARLRTPVTIRVVPGALQVMVA